MAVNISWTLFSLLCLTTVIAEAYTYTGIDCYECNLNLCTRNTTDSKECTLLKEYYNTPMNETKQRHHIWNEMEKFSGCKDNITTNCTACAKFVTTYRRIVKGGIGREDTVLSRVCAKETPHSNEDFCYKSGPRYATREKCYCFSSLCNSALSQKSASIIHLTGLVILSGWLYQSS